jgi:hypothetical protein
VEVHQFIDMTTPRARSSSTGSLTTSEAAGATSTPTQVPHVSAGLSPNAKFGISTGFSLGAGILVIVSVVYLHSRRCRRNRRETTADGPDENIQDKPELEAGNAGIYSYAEPQVIDHQREIGWGEPCRNNVKTLDQEGHQGADLTTTQVTSTDGTVEPQGSTIPPVHTITNKQIDSSDGNGTPDELKIGRAL